ncbi:hypothetical protein M9Y10_029548 [Tritrichomonas musculus]|uniref:Transmembrane protein n=1 Tax=Tritrichomonas musculus TaxID=1915356 RepID=A0ABR2KPH2_9EUKA
MGKQYPDIDSNPQKIIFLVSVGVNVLTSFILAIIGFVWFSKLDICPNFITGKPAVVYYLSIVSGIIAIVGLVTFIVYLIVYIVFRAKQKFINNQELTYKITMGKTILIINFIASFIAIICSIFGLNHDPKGNCVAYLEKILHVNELCRYGGGPDYSVENRKIIEKFAEDPGYYCEKNGTPLLILAIINIISIITFIVAYCLGKKNPIEESSIAEGQVEIESNQNMTNQNQQD